MDTVTLRYFKVYSPRQDPIFGYAGAITRFDTRPRFGETPVICGDGEQTRESAGGNR